MIFAVLSRGADESAPAGVVARALGLDPQAASEVATDGPFALVCTGAGEPTPALAAGIAASADGTGLAACTGVIHNHRELLSRHSPGAEARTSPAALILELYRKLGPEFARELNGRFAFAVWDKSNRQLVAGRDHLGLEPLYYYRDESLVILSSSMRPMLRSGQIARRLNPQAVRSYLVFNYNPGLQTMIEGIHRLRPAHVVLAGPTGWATRCYWRPSFQKTLQSGEAEITEELRERLDRAVRLRLTDGRRPGVFLSGGMDSSSVLGLASACLDEPVHTFSYRCRGEGFDESHHARRMAESVGAVHDVAEYSASDLLSMPELVAEMNEPFCDSGINLATWILGRKAAGQVDFVFTGDGGDELFGGHPIYEADKAADRLRFVPGVLRKPILGLGSLLPDSDKKKNLVVKVKRFSESLGLPEELLSHRWRAYYRLPEMLQLLTPSLSGGLTEDDLYADIYQYNEENDGRDLLTRSVYSDYQTVVDFYLRRNDLIRKLSVETRFPMLDPDLITKIQGWFDTKYILKKSMEGLLPHDIIYRKDKLGHSIPLKNWIRDDPDVRGFILDFLSEDSVRRRGLFRYAAVEKMIAEHMKKRRNNAHRLWTLAVLEMWLREHYDSPGREI